jgi:hypothetical protein
MNPKTDNTRSASNISFHFCVGVDSISNVKFCTTIRGKRCPDIPTWLCSLVIYVYKPFTSSLLMESWEKFQNSPQIN